MVVREVKEFREFREGSCVMRTALPKFPLIVVREFKEFKEFRDWAYRTALPLLKFPNKKNLSQHETFLLLEWCSSGDDMKKPPMGST